MRTSAIRQQLEAAAGVPLIFQPRPPAEILSTGIAALDASIGGLPRGALTEICGPASSGRTTLLLSAMAQATAGDYCCALIDASGAFDPASAAAAGVHLPRLLWVRCGGNAELALKAADLVVQAGGFGMVAMDLADIPTKSARRISMTSWFRLRRAVENTPAALVVVEREPLANTCASLVLELRRDASEWSGAPGCSRLFRGLRIHVERRKPVAAARAAFTARAREA
jgi:hypothetical protein